MKLNCYISDTLQSCISGTILLSPPQNNHQPRCIPCTLLNSDTPNSFTMNTAGIALKWCWGNSHCLYRSQCIQSRHNWHSFPSRTTSTSPFRLVCIHRLHRNQCNLSQHNLDSDRSRTTRTALYDCRPNSHFLHHTPCTSPDSHSEGNSQFSTHHNRLRKWRSNLRIRCTSGISNSNTPCSRGSSRPRTQSSGGYWLWSPEKLLGTWRYRWTHWTIILTPAIPSLSCHWLDSCKLKSK